MLLWEILSLGIETVGWRSGSDEDIQGLSGFPDPSLILKKEYADTDILA